MLTILGAGMDVRSRMQWLISLKVFQDLLGTKRCFERDSRDA